jgi:hypothetical protein
MKEDEIGEACNTHGREKYAILVGKPEGKRPLGRPRRRWENVRMYRKEIRCELVNWMHPAQDGGQVAGPCEHCNKPSGCIKGGEFLD